MNHIKNIAKELHNLGLDAMLVTSEPGEFYAIGLPRGGRGPHHPPGVLVLHRLPVH